MINNLVGGLFGKIVDNAEGILDKVITTDKERDEAKLALKKLLLDAEREAFAKEVEDRKSARDMYKDDAIIQKVLATLFISTIFGAMSAKVNTIIDFFFGGSSKKNEQSKEK
jgi:hypothetical protein